MSIDLIDVSKSFKTDTVLDRVSLSVASGETLVLFGPSGAGKTVLLRLIAGVVEPDSGSIRIAGRDMHEVEPEHRGVGMAFQNFALFPHMDAAANIAAPLEARRAGSGAIKGAVDRVAKMLKIDHVLHHKPKELSNGQKQRTALARALSGEPSVLLLDDPLRNVDAKLRFEMRLELPRLLKDRESTVIYVTQDYKEAMALGDRIAVLSHAGLVQVGTPEEIYLAPANTEIARLFGDPVINLLDVTPERGERGVQVRLSDRPLAIDPGFAHALGAPCILGVRPEAVRFADAAEPGAIPVEVEAEMSLNEKTVTLCATARRREILVSRPAGTPGPDHGAAHIAIDAAGALLFDRESGARIAPAPEAARIGEVA
ncbi:ABC transporter ATP-binding protein [Rhodovulum sp. DZ06]|uniref:ABC transporter ATP-binding protein n=1 Tax=Rhodovulum sp. DZ06 TaxID=3425126 RepID=UPI003D346A57